LFTGALAASGLTFICSATLRPLGLRAQGTDGIADNIKNTGDIVRTGVNYHF
jgi:hypothetical protein